MSIVHAKLTYILLSSKVVEPAAYILCTSKVRFALGTTLFSCGMNMCEKYVEKCLCLLFDQVCKTHLDRQALVCAFLKVDYYIKHQSVQILLVTSIRS